MTAELAFKARELSASGVWSGRIAQLLGVEERLVLRALGGVDFDEPASVGEPVDEPARVDASRPVDPNAWPPPVDESTHWSTVRVRTSWPHSVEVRVRQVRLWGKRVLINDENEVWCPSCQRFRTTAQLGHPFNGCPVGLPTRAGPVEVSFDPESPNYVAEPPRRDRWDLFRSPW